MDACVAAFTASLVDAVEARCSAVEVEYDALISAKEAELDALRNEKRAKVEELRSHLGLGKCGRPGKSDSLLDAKCTRRLKE